MPTKKSTQKKFPKTKLNLIILGDPGAGKATQAKYFAKKYLMYDFDMGRELTLLRQKSLTTDQIIKKSVDKGFLAPTKIVRDINKKIVLGLPKSKSILFDGHPKMIGEAKLISKYLKETKRSKPLVLYISIPNEEIIKRTHLRKGYSNTKFNRRSDDTISALKNRAKYYRKNIAEVVKFFKSNYTFATINGLGDRVTVRKRIQKAIDFYLNHYEQIHQKTRRN